MDIKQKKRILQDPVAQFSRVVASATAQQKQRLETLHRQFVQLKNQYKELQTKAGQISRQIGQAKAKNQVCDDLMDRMKQHSVETKNVSTELQAIEIKILAMFSAQNDSVASAQPSAPPAVAETNAPQLQLDKITIKPFSESDSTRWNDYVANNPACSVYHKQEWHKIIHETFGHAHFYYYAEDHNRRVVGVLPLIRLTSRMFGDFLVSMPYVNYGGAIADDASIEQLLMQSANAEAAKLGVEHIEYRDSIARPDMPVRAEKVNMLLTLPDSEDQLWNSFTPKLRAQIKRPQRENPRIRVGQFDCLDDFYAVFARNMRDLGTPVYSKLLFFNILNHFPQQARIITVALNKRPVAAAFLLGHKNGLEIPWASTLRLVNNISVNMLLYWEVLRFAIHNKYAYFDFGRSSIDSGTFKFKQQWGAQPKPSYWHYWLNNGKDLPALNPSNPKYALMIRTWQKLPVSLTKLIGPLIVKYLP